MEDNFDYIGDYFEGKLKGEEKKHFENKWEHEDSFAKDVAFYLRLKTELKKEKLNNISTAIKTNSTDKPKVKKLFSRRKSLSIAAGLVFVIGALVVYNMKWKSLDTRAIASTYDISFSSKEMMDGIRETNGIAAVNLEEQKQRMEYLDSLYVNDKTDCASVSENYLNNSLAPYFEREIRLLRALSLKQINNKDFTESRIILEDLKRNGDTDYLDVIEWNLSLIHLYEGNIESAKEILEQMVQLYPNSKYTENAKDILKEIK